MLTDEQRRRIVDAYQQYLQAPNRLAAELRAIYQEAQGNEPPGKMEEIADELPITRQMVGKWLARQERGDPPPRRGPPVS